MHIFIVNKGKSRLDRWQCKSCAWVKIKKEAVLEGRMESVLISDAEVELEEVVGRLMVVRTGKRKYRR